MAEEAKEITIVVASCTEKEWPDGSKSFVVECTLDGQQKTFYCKEDLGTGTVKATRYGEKNTIYKPKAGGGSGGGNRGQGAPRDYTYEGRMRAVDAIIAHAQGKGDLNFICTSAAALQDFYKNGTIPPKKEAQ